VTGFPLQCALCGKYEDDHIEVSDELRCPHRTWGHLANTDGKVFTAVLRADEVKMLGDETVAIVERGDDVNRPAHYTSHPSGVECIEITEHMNLCLGSAMQYIWRAGLKGNENYHKDLQKAIWYLEREIARTKPDGGDK